MDGLWDVPFDQSSINNVNSSTLSINNVTLNNCLTPTHDKHKHSCNYILMLDKSKYELAQYFYGCLFAPALTTLQKAIKKGNLLSWPGIQTINFNKLVGKNIAHEKRHLDQEKQNLRSTKLHISLTIDS